MNDSTDKNDFDSLCGRFEEEWQTGRNPSLEHYVERVSTSERSALLKRLLHIELWWRRSDSPSPTAEQYRQRFPDSVEAVDSAYRAFEERTFLSGESDGNDAFATTESPPPGSFDPTPRFTPPPKNRRGLTSRIGPYKILQPIGEGGMGQVFMADQEEPIKRRVALKLINTDAPSDKILARFEAERQALAMMDHQNIAKVLDAGITGEGKPYFAMELVKGVPITEYCDTSKLSPEERLELFVQVCRAIQHAHQKGIIHRDIKPSNVLITLYDGKPVAKVIDFGLAKALQSQLQLTERTMFTQYGQVVGTLEYMSPEQAEMNALDVDTRTDVYSLGVMLYELLTGSTPIGRERLKSQAFDRILQLIREEEVARPSIRLSESGDAITDISQQRKTDARKLSLILKGDLDWIAIKALEKDRTRRYDSAAALADDIDRYLQHEPIEARPPTFGYRLNKSLRKHKAEFISAAAVVVLLLIGLAVTGFMWHRARTEATRALAAETKAKNEANNARRAESQATKFAREARKNLLVAEKNAYASDMILVQRCWNESDVPQLKRILDRYDQREDLAGFEWGYWNRRLAGELASFANDGTDICIGADWRRVAVRQVDREGGAGIFDFREIVSLWNDAQRLWVPSKRQRPLILKPETRHGTIRVGSPFGYGRTLAINADGHRLASADNNMVTVWGTDSGKRISAFEVPDVSTISLSPDGSRCATHSDGEPFVRIFDVTSGKEQRTIDVGIGYCHAGVFSPDGKRLALFSLSQLRIWDLDGTADPLVIKVREQGLFQFANVLFSPDGAILAVGSHQGQIAVLDSQTGKKRYSVRTDNFDRVKNLAFSPDGTRLAATFADRDSEVTIWQLGPSDSVKERNLRSHGETIGGLTFSPDGNRLSTIGPKLVKVWDTKLDPDQSSSRLDIRAINKDASLYVTAEREMSTTDEGQTVRVIRSWDSSSRRELSAIREYEGELAFSPDLSKYAIWRDRLGDPCCVLDLRTKKSLRVFQSRVMCIDNLLFCPSGEQVMLVSMNVRSGTDEDVIRDAQSWDRIHGSEDSKKRRDFFENSSVGAVKILDLNTGRENTLLELYDRELGSWGGDGSGSVWNDTEVAFSGDGRRVAFYAETARDRILRLWDVESGQRLAVPWANRKHRTRELSGVKIALDYSGQRLAICGVNDESSAAGEEPELRVWDTTTAKDVFTIPTVVKSSSLGDRCTQLTFCGDDRWVALAVGNEFKVLDAKNGAERIYLRHGEGVDYSGGHIAVSRSGNRVATQFDRSVKLWDSTTGRELLTLTQESDNGLGNFHLAFGWNDERLISRNAIWQATPWTAHQITERSTDVYLRGLRDELLLDELIRQRIDDDPSISNVMRKRARGFLTLLPKATVDELCGAAARLLVRAQRPREEYQLGLRFMQVSGQKQTLSQEQQCLLALGHYRLHEYREAIQAFDDDIVLSEVTADRVHPITTLLIALCKHKLDDVEGARELLIVSRELLEEHQEHQRLLSAWMSGVRSGEHDQADEAMAEAKKLAASKRPRFGLLRSSLSSSLLQKAEELMEGGSRNEQADDVEGPP